MLLKTAKDIKDSQSRLDFSWCNKTNIAMELAIKEYKKKEKTNTEVVPEEFHNYLDIFSEEKAHWFPETQPWDHKIEMKKGFEPKSSKIYNLTPAEQIKLDKFLRSLQCLMLSGWTPTGHDWTTMSPESKFLW